MGKNSKVCFLQYALRGGGAERRVCTLANYFANKGYEVDIGLYGTFEIAYDLDPRVNVTFIRRNTYQYKNVWERISFFISLFCQRVFVYVPVVCFEKLNKLMKIKKLSSITGRRVLQHYHKLNDYTKPLINYIKCRSDSVFITMMISSYLGIIDTIGLPLYSKISKQFIVMDCSDPKKNAPGKMDQMRNMYYPMAAKSIVQTQGAKDYFSSDVQHNMMIIPNPVRNDLPERYVDIRKKTIVNYCRLTEAKNLPLLIDAFALFRKKYPNYSLYIYGQGELYDTLNAKIEAMHLQESVFICPFDSHLHSKILDAGMYVSTSNWEGFPNSLLEAMSIGLPVISTDCDFGPRDLIENNVNGLLVPVNDAEALCAAMCKIAEDSAFADRIAARAYETRQKYHVDVIGREWIRLIETIMNQAGR